MKKFMCNYGIPIGLLFNSICYLFVRNSDAHILAIPGYIIAVTFMILGAYYSKKAYDLKNKEGEYEGKDSKA